MLSAKGYGTAKCNVPDLRSLLSWADRGAAFSTPLKDTDDGCAVSRFAILTATFCSSAVQRSRDWTSPALVPEGCRKLDP